MDTIPPMSTHQAAASTPEVLLGRYHARDVEIRELNRRRLETIEKLTAARKELKRIKSKGPGEDPTPADRHEWEAKIGRQSLAVEALAAAKVSAELALNQAIGNKALPLFKAPPEEVAEDCMRSGIALLLEQGISLEDIRGKFRFLLDTLAYRFRVEQPRDEDEDGEDDDGQGSLFGDDVKRDRGERERQLAWMLRGQYQPPRPFTWLEVVAHLADADLDAGWRWGAAPHKHEMPAAIAALIDGNVEGFAREPGLPETIKLTDKARERLGFDMAVEIDDAGHVVVAAAGSEPAQQVGQIEAPQMVIPTFVAARMIAAADPRWSSIVRDDFTWNGRETASAPRPPAPTIHPVTGRNPGLEDIPPDVLRKALAENDGSPTRAGQALGITRDALRRRCKHFGIDIDSYKPERERS